MILSVPRAKPSSRLAPDGSLPAGKLHQVVSSGQELQIDPHDFLVAHALDGNGVINRRRVNDVVAHLFQRGGSLRKLTPVVFMARNRTA